MRNKDRHDKGKRDRQIEHQRMRKIDRQIEHGVIRKKDRQ
jgi:hypothetical protein